MRCPSRSRTLLARSRAAAALLFGAALPGCGAEVAEPADEARVGPHLNVVLICLDTVRAGHLGAYGYDRHPTSPHLDRLAESSWVFRNASSTANWTKPSVATYLTGLLPAQHGVYEPTQERDGVVIGDTLPAATTTLAETYAANGYATHALVTNSQIDSGLGYEQGFETYRDSVGKAGQICGDAMQWLEQHDGERPFFLYLHFLDAHPPIRLPEGTIARFSDPDDVVAGSMDWRALRRAVNHGRRELDDATVEALIAAYDDAIRYIDEELGKLFESLERAGRMEDTVVCVVSDHGEEFVERSRLGHGRGHDLHETLLHVAWILRVPDLEPREVDQPCSLVDLYPTLLSAAGLPADDGPGFGIDRLARPEESRPIVAEHLDERGYQQSVRLGDSKVLRHLSPRGEGRRHRITREVLAETYGGRTPDGTEPHAHLVRAFDLALDPAEEDPTNDAGRDELVEVGQNLLRDLLERRLWRADDEAELSAQQVQALRELGYAGEDDG